LDIGAWLCSLGLQQYEPVFRENAVDVETLPQLTEADLEKLGVLLGHRKRILRAVATLQSAPAAGPVRPDRPAERRQLTILFCDLVGSTPLAARLDPEDLTALLGLYHRTVSEVAEKFGGFVAKFMGDGVLVYFGYPQALMIDLSSMRAVRVDPWARRAWVQGGATWGDVDCETTAFGLATPGGLISTTGVGGLTLSGGVGWLRGTAGLCVDNVISADVVTADGCLLRASETENPDLYWAIRGGGGNFGIVVGFEFRLRPIEPLLMFCAAVYPEIRAAELLPQWRDFMTAAQDQVSSLAEFSTIPDDPEYPEVARGQRVLALAAVYDGPADEGEVVTSPLRSFGPPLLDLSARMPYRAIQSLYDPLFPKGRDRSYFRSLYLPSLDERAIGDIVAGLAARPSEMTFSAVWYFGEVVRRVAAEATAFGDRSQPWLFSIDAIWSKREEDAANIAWARKLWSTMRPYSNGRLYLNFLAANDDLNVMRDGVGRETYKKLAKIKAKYDPTNFFRLNQNIVPV
jgi:FAD/FMN-containing dehydrogenase